MADRGRVSMSPYNMLHRPIPIPQALTIPEEKAALEKEWETLQKLQALGIVTSDQQNRGDTSRATLEGKKVDFCHIHGLVSSQQLQIGEKIQKYTGTVVLRGVVVRDDSGDYAVFTEQGASASHMSAANVLDVISRLLGCSGQASDVVSACT